MYLITAYFDSETERLLQKHIDRIAAKSGNTFMTENNVPPHLTITSIQTREEQSVLDLMIELEKQNLSGAEIDIVSLGIFLPQVLYAIPVLNTDLDQFSKQIFFEAEKNTKLQMGKYYRYRNWLPHITLAKTLSAEQLQTAFKIMQQYFVPIHGRITEIGLSKVNPYRELVRFSLK